MVKVRIYEVSSLKIYSGNSTLAYEDIITKARLRK
jgi:hypothetical protein